MEHFAFTKLVVADLEASAAFYTQVFGLQEHRRVQDDIGGRAMEEILFESTTPGGATFVLLHFDDTPEPAAGSVIGGFITDEIDELFPRAWPPARRSSGPSTMRPSTACGWASSPTPTVISSRSAAAHVALRAVPTPAHAPRGRPRTRR
jgi:catechol 2,3-dioxygenase-like lactoylglutathione lyase family enzyme